ncbi:PREDICTED: F-box/kelch-repeat protein At3g23880-like [Lupinus angustifolius]|uniref:F-box/kelch-repeat protein At3g23880-like n=1 Tax=Lupinus angustifolius TaxID=3871 RepID=UPI00092EF238|nr:PREDICTED: F-box/kelch-repeat protein At3g23880-like [Lupinus angustifolius]
MSQISDGHDNNNKNEPPTIPHGDSLHAPPPFLPFELIIEILSRVPVKSLIQFKCVCKSWKTLISDPQFAKKHLSTIQHNHHNHHLLLSMNDTLDNMIFGSYSLQSIFETSPPISTQVSYPFNTQNCFDLMVGSCDGMLCFAVNKSCALLWNPTIRVFKKLPPLEEYTIYGFGFDQCSDSYKVVAILRHEYYSDDESAWVTEVKVHNLGTDSWRTIQGCPSGIPTGFSATFVSGTLNWLASNDPDLSSYAIVSLDLGKESCQELLQPDYREVAVLSFNLGVLKNCLSIIVHYEEGSSDIWLMNDYGKKESWTKFLCLPYLGSPNLFPYGRVICIYEDDEVLLELHSELAIYNFRNGTFKVPEIPGFSHLSGWPVPRIYVESLVSPCS